MKKILIIFLIILTGCVSSNNENKISLKEKKRNEDIENCKYYGFNVGTNEFSNCLMKLDNARRHAKMLECENVRRDNSNSGVTGFWGGVLLGMRENLACSW